MHPLPRSARLLGASGLLPAGLCLAAATLHDDPAWRMTAIRAGMLYAAVILSFLGGAWWGLAARAPGPAPAGLFALAVLPSLAGWALVMLANPPAVMALGGIIALTPAVDHLLDRGGVAPPGWLKLRLPLSLALGALTIGLGAAAGNAMAGV